MTPGPDPTPALGLYGLARPLLFASDPERVHHLAIGALARGCTSRRLLHLMEAKYAVRHRALAQELWGLRFPAPVGLAAGLDKSAHAPLAWQALGFGFAEFGTVTPRPQIGNPRPRLWRDRAAKGLVNRMGFNNDGVAAVARRIDAARLHASVPWGVNIGKQRDTPLDQAGEDYLACLEAAAPVADFLVVNVSSPNTPGLRELQKPERLRALLGPLAERARARNVPLLVKLDPDLDPADLEAAVEVALDVHVDGLVCTNTSASLPLPQGAGPGGVSGAPLRARSTEVLRRVALRVDGELPLVGVGGVFSAEDAYEKVLAGASLVEVYTGFVYRGPGLARALHDGLAALLQKAGHGHVREAVGAGLKERSVRASV